MIKDWIKTRKGMISLKWILLLIIAAIALYVMWTIIGSTIKAGTYGR